MKTDLTYGALGRAAKRGRAAFLAISVAFSLPLAAQADTVIAALGDSLTQGYGLPAEQGFVPQLERWLNEQGHEVRMINAGVSGDTTAGGLSRIGWTLTDEVDALIVTLGGNDLLRGLPPEMTRDNLNGILATAQSKQVPVLLVGLTAPGNYGPDYKQAFEAIFPDLAATYGTLYAPSFLAPIEAALESGTPLSDMMQRDGIHPNANGVAMIVNALGPKVAQLID